ncbi:MAG: diguanylate cyclase [Candidatus Omnitrophota bacterium]|nr:diguanylate cyclase [Candidatus Omnitrophota bacterium]
MSRDVKIVLAVPDLKLREILLYLLKAWEYNVMELPEEEDVIEYLKKENPNLIIIDATLHGKKGLEICKEIKGDFLTSYIPTIVLIDKKQLRRDLLSIEQGVDDYLIKPPDPIDLEIRIVLALRSAAHHFNANALTRLPGNKLIERELIQRLDSGNHFSFHYIDIDNFKSYNDKYGYIRGNHVIIDTARIISKNVKVCGNGKDFVGHIGGDDFVIITTPDKAEPIAKQTIRDFDAMVPGRYSNPDLENGFIVARERSGRIANIPLMSLSIAIVNNTLDNVSNLLELMDVTTELKNYLKALPGSNFMVNRRVIDNGIKNRKDKKYKTEKRQSI